MELRQLRTFVAVAEEGGFSAAARRLDTAQSAVSAAVRRLEADLGAELFERTTHRVSLTQAGLALLPHAREVLEAVRAAREAVDLVGEGLRGELSVGIMQSQVMTTVSMGAVLAAFRARHPFVHVRLLHLLGGSRALAAGVVAGRLDLAVVSLPDGPPAGAGLTELSREPIRLAVADRDGLAGRASVTLEDLRGREFAEWPTSWGTRILNDILFAAAGVARTVGYEVNDTSSVLDLVRHGVAIAIMPASVLRHQPGVVAIPIRGVREDFVISLVRPTSRRSSAAAGAFADELQRQARLASGV